MICTVVESLNTNAVSVAVSSAILSFRRISQDMKIRDTNKNKMIFFTVENFCKVIQIVLFLKLFLLILFSAVNSLWILSKRPFTNCPLCMVL